MDNIQQFSNAVIKGASMPGIQGDPIVSNAMAGSFRLGAQKRAGNAMGVVAQQQADEEEKRRQAEQQRRIQELQDQMDPSKYQQVRKDDGGFAFFDPSGKEIDIDTYAKRTGQRRVDVLKDSENPLDQQFIDDYMQMNDLNQKIWQNDTEEINNYKLQYPELFSNGNNPTPEEINKKLLEKYPHIYGMGQYERSYSNLGKPLFRMTGSSSSGGGIGY